MPFYQFALIAAFGAAFEEMLHWWVKRRELDKVEYRGALMSPTYWLIATAVVLGSGIGAAIAFRSQTDDPRVIMFVGAAFPLFFQKVMRAIRKRLRFGGSSTWDAYLP